MIINVRISIYLYLGWKRQVVVRSVTDGSKKRGDVYYHTPTGNKLVGNCGHSHRTQ